MHACIPATMRRLIGLMLTKPNHRLTVVLRLPPVWRCSRDIPDVVGSRDLSFSRARCANIWLWKKTISLDKGSCLLLLSASTILTRERANYALKTQEVTFSPARVGLCGLVAAYVRPSRFDDQPSHLYSLHFSLRLFLF